MTRYSLPVMLSEQFYAMAISNAPERHHIQLSILQFSLFLFSQFHPHAISLLPREESQKNLRITTMISKTITMTFTFTEKSGGISCKAV